MTLTRRRFLQSSGAALALPAFLRARVRGANDDLRVAVVGLRGRGKDHVEGFRRLEGVRVVALCDCDPGVLAAAARAFARRDEKLATYADVRALLEAKDIDLVSIATPNHWHALLGIWACQAGKDAYVEKPIAHNVHEGRVLVEAARKHGRIVACGTQSRSNPGLREAIAWVQSGGLGKIEAVRGLCYKRRKSIGKVAGPQKLPDGLDYDLWTGPAPLRPLAREQLHYDWHWVWDTGNGDLGNQGVHQMDMARWILGAGALAPRVLSVGGRLGYEDDGETPNSQIVVHDYPQAPLVFEVRGLPEASGADKMDAYKGAGIGVVAECEGGWLSITSYSGGTAFDRDGKVVKTFRGDGDHYANCVAAVRARRPQDLTADAREGHLSAALCHAGNISYRLGKATPQGELREHAKANPALAEAFGRLAEHLGRNGVDLERTPLTLGMPLELDPVSERFAGNAAADALWTRAPREPFVVPDVP